MPAIIESIVLKPELTTDGVDFLLGQIFAKITATITVKAEWILEADADNTVSFFATNKIKALNQNFKQKGFLVGDQFVITGTSGNDGTRHIQSFEDNGATIVTVESSVANESDSDSAVITGDMEITGANFKYNLIENDDIENYDSKVDGNEMKFAKGGIDFSVTTDTDMIAQGVYKSNQIGGATIKGTGTGNEFIITHTFYINPFFTLDQLTDLLAGKAPEYFLDLKCLKYIYHIDLLYNINDPNRVHASNADTFLLGNTGWANENFNAGVPKFYIDQIVFQRISNAQIIDFADYNSPTNIFIRVKSVDGVFSNNNTKFVLNHIILPEEEEQFIDTATDMTTNFMFDRNKQTVGAAVVNGDEYGTDKQVLKEIHGAFVNANEVFISAVIDLSPEYIARIEALADKRMTFVVTIQDHTKQTEASDIVACLKTATVYDTDLSNEEVGDINTEFNFFPDITTTSSEAGMFSEDTQRGKSIIGVDTTNGATIKDISVIIRAENGSKSFVLQQKNFSFSGAVIQAGVQQINIEEPRGFTLDPTNPFYNFSLKRRSDLDAGNIKKYELIYPFKIRWEDFISLGNVDSDFYDITKKFNGFNQQWSRYFDGAGWSLVYVIRARIEENGVINAVSKESELIAYDYDEAEDWTTTIKIFDIDTNLEVPDDILSDKIVRVEASHTKISGTLPSIDDVAGTIEYEPFEQGGEEIIRNINTVYIHESTSPFVSVLSNKLLKKEKISNVYKFTANIDGRKLTGSPKLSSRIYDLTVPPFGSSKDFQDGDDFEFQDSDNYDFQDV